MISIVVPAFNEELAIKDTVIQIKKTLLSKKYKVFEIIVVDDGSVDKTGYVAKRAGAKVIKHPHNAGYGRSLKTGIVSAKYDTIVITDADGTYPIQKINDLIDLYYLGFDMVVGQRTGQKYRGSPLKWPMRILLRFLVEWTTGRKIPDINSGLRVFSRSTVINYFDQLCDTFSFTTSVTLAYMMTSKFVKYEKIEYNDRVGSSHVRLWRDSLRTLQYVIQAIIYYNPLKIFLLITISCIFLSVASLIVGIFFSIHTGFLMSVAFTLAAITTFCFGLLADLLRQILVKQ